MGERQQPRGVRRSVRQRDEGAVVEVELEPLALRAGQSGDPRRRPRAHRSRTLRARTPYLSSANAAEAALEVVEDETRRHPSSRDGDDRSLVHTGHREQVSAGQLGVELGDAAVVAPVGGSAREQLLHRAREDRAPGRRGRRPSRPDRPNRSPRQRLRSAAKSPRDPREPAPPPSPSRLSARIQV